MRQILKTICIHGGLFLLTCITTLMVGAELRTNRFFFSDDPAFQLNWSEIDQGWMYSFAFLLFLTVHEFGHYFVAKLNKVKASLPYYIPLYIPGMLNIGSLGAVIRIRETPRTTAQYFDIGIAGPLAGFVIAIGLLVYGFQTLPPQSSYLLPINPAYVTTFGHVPSDAEMTRWIKSGGPYTQLSDEEKASLLDEEELLLPPETQDSLSRSRFIYPGFRVGSSLLFEVLKKTAKHPERVPNHYDLIHYPWLFVGYLALFFTALNLLPIGQLDGGHVMYGLLGRQKAARLARAVVVLLLLAGGTGMLRWGLWEAWEDSIAAAVYIALVTYVAHKLLPGHPRRTVYLIIGLILALQTLMTALLENPIPSPIWLLYAFLAVRVIGFTHPPAWREHKLDTSRQVLGWIAVLIFILCFSIYPIEVVT